MKKFIILTTIFFLGASSSLFSQIKVNSSGNVGINQPIPTYRLDLTGTFRMVDSGTTLLFQSGSLYPTAGTAGLGTYSYKWSYLYSAYAYLTYSPIITSDANMKTNVRDFQDVSSKFTQLRPVIYQINKDKLNLDQKSDKIVDQYGLIAQEVAKLFPDIVTSNEDGTMGIRYTELIPVLIKMIQTQQIQLDDLKAQIAKLSVKTN